MQKSDARWRLHKCIDTKSLVHASELSYKYIFDRPDNLCTILRLAGDVEFSNLRSRRREIWRN